MIKDEIFRKTEGMLYRYYEKLKLKDKLNYRVEVLQNKIYRLEQDMINCNVVIDADIKAIDYSKDRVQGGICRSNIENELEKEIEKLERELKQAKVKLIRTKRRINQIEDEISNIEFAITQLSEEAKKLVELKYGTWPKLSNIEIGLRMNMAEATVRRKRKEVVEAIAKWMNIS
ncbi:hypothetical protein [Caloramator sp. Dgby_cultured_2]|uniref:hypothetical protein n=1 Tax=Caloramator sp. Dgby_cultured_2 TaxID=3029174 RepID=UPI00237E51D6|nr:hypothetical protein [Caloramator sp. Dgby_cultured_2]WDU82293.1 hypothetical protein PWK10_11370 [Caloramator sp. Dgby_cultured_2]